MERIKHLYHALQDEGSEEKRADLWQEILEENWKLLARRKKKINDILLKKEKQLLFLAKKLKEKAQKLH